MEKKYLKKALPIQEASRTIKSLAERTEGKILITKAERKGDILALSLYSAEEIKKGEYLPIIKTFYEKSPEKDFISLRKVTDKKYQWTEAAYSNMQQLSDIKILATDSKKTNKMISSFFKEEGNVEKIIHFFQKEVKLKKLSLKQEERRKRILDEMSINNDPPKEFFEWIEESREKYVFYKKNVNKITFKTTCCCNEGSAEKKDASFKHNKQGNCPICGKTALFVSENKSSFKYQAYNACYIQKEEDRIIFRYYSYYRTDNTLFPRETPSHKYEALRTIISGGQTNRYEKINGEWKYSPQNGERVQLSPMVAKSGLELYGTARIYPGNIEEAIKDTEYERSGIDYYARFYKKSIDMEVYLAFYKQRPETELIMKSGLYRLASQLPYTGWQKKEDARTIYDILGLTKENFRIARKYDFNRSQIEILQTIQEANKKAAPDDIIFYSKLNLYNKERMIEYIYRKGGTLKKLLNLLRKEEVKKFGQKTKPSPDRQAEILSIYKDYIHMAEEIDLRMEDPYYLFPPDINKAHDMAVERYNAEREMIKQKQKEEEERRIEEKMRSLSFEMEEDIEALQTEDLMVRLPKSAKDLYEEGDCLHHCVGTYAEKVADGKSVILFIRKKDAPDTPYVTMEWAEKILQVRGIRNSVPDEHTLDFSKIINKILIKKGITTNSLIKNFDMAEPGEAG